MAERRAGAILAAGLLLTAAACGPGYRHPRTVPPGEPGHPVVNLRFRAETPQERQKGRLVMDVDGRRARVLFLNPFNRVLLELHLNNDTAVLVNRRRGRYWQGGFRALVRRLWGLRLDFFTLKDLILQPWATIQMDPALKIQVDRDPVSGLSKRLEVRGRDASLLLTVLRRRRVEGGLAQTPSLAQLERAGLEEVLSRGE